MAEYAERDTDGDIAPVPALIPRAVGYGAGKRDSWIPNLLRLIVGDTYGEPVKKPYGTRRLPLTRPLKLKAR